MSYLNPLRLHFFGQFQANVSTVNNDAYHFNNAAFIADYQKMQGQGMQPPNGWFNPEGDGVFRLLGCKVSGAYLPSGPVPASDPVLSHLIADSDEQAPAKLVDLDPEQQLVSQIWGLTVRIADAKTGATLMQGEFEPCAFFDIWDRGLQRGGGDTNAGACWQSVLKNVQWGKVSASPFLTALKKASTNGFLSIKFNMDGINMTYSSPDFMCGRLAGTIGPYVEGEPKHFVMGRQFMARAAAGGNFFLPAGKLNFFAGTVNSEVGCVFLDLGNALPSTIAGGPIADIGDLTLAYVDPLATPGNPAGTMVALATIPASTYAGADWYKQTAGVFAAALDAEQLAMASTHPLALYNTNLTTAIAESPSAAFVRADTIVWRLSPGDIPEIPVYAMQLGKPLPNATINFEIDNSQLQTQVGSGFPFAGPSPEVGKPTAAIPIPASASTDAKGMATLRFTAGNPGNVRWFNHQQDYGIDGQVYGVRPSFADAGLAEGPVNQWDFISFQIYANWSPQNSPPTWTDVQPIFQQYANLYPVMNRFLDLGSFEGVKKNARLLTMAFGLPMSDPNHMPVTRDLSPAKREAILTFLQDPQEGAGVTAVPAHQADNKSTQETQQKPPEHRVNLAQGGKAAAAARRLVLQQNKGDIQ